MKNENGHLNCSIVGSVIKGVAALSATLMLISCGGNDVPTVTQTPQNQFHATVTAADYSTLVTQLYVSYFGRPADSGGFANFKQRLADLNAPTDIQGLTAAYKSSAAMRELIDSFGTSAESKSLYSGDTASFVTAIYTNLLSRAPDAEGRNFWASAIDSGELTRANASLAIMAGAFNNPTTQGQADAKLISNRVSVAKLFSDALVGTAAVAFSGDAAAATARTMLVNVNANTNTATFQGVVNTTLSNLIAAVTAEGAYLGTLTGSSNSTFNLLVLENDEYWGMYGTTLNNNFFVSGFFQGQGTSSSGLFSSSSLRDFGVTPAISGTLSATYAPKGNITGAVQGGGTIVTFSGAPISSSIFDYSSPPRLSDVAGAWTMSDPSGGAVAVVVSSGGAVSGDSGGCKFTGTLTPRATGKNVLNVQLTFGAAPCSLPNQIGTGIAISYLIAGTSTRQFIVLVVTGDRTKGVATFGRR